MMKKHEFVLVLSGVSDITAELSDALYAATGGDIEFNLRDGVAFLEFDRETPTLYEAITTAIDEVEQTGIRVVRVESESANTIAKINADLLGSSASF